MTPIWCSECGGPCEATYELRNGREVDRLCQPCFRDTVFDLITSNWTVTFTEVKDESIPLIVYEL